MMSLPDTRGNIDGYPIPIGLGIGIDFSGDKTITRIKGYSWLFACITLDYNIKITSISFLNICIILWVIFNV